MNLVLPPFETALEHLVDLGLLGDEGVQGRLPVAPGLLGADFVGQGW
jgi:hypothetical protein